MEAFITDWLAMIVRWLHFITGAAWIGTSFYFNWLNHSFRPPEDGEEGIKGEVWSIHGGEFYRTIKFKVAPEKLPTTLHWFKWEAYFTWITGFSLLSLVYYLNAKSYLLDPSVSGVTHGVAIGIGVATLVVGWFVYDLLCKSPLGKKPVIFAAVGFVLMTALAYGLCQIFNPRGAYIHIGALIGTIMAANVFRVIIPNQKIMVDAMYRGEKPDGNLGQYGAQRSLHNNYLTLPVLFIMISNHYPATYGHEYNWAILAALALIGAGTRHYFNLKHKGRHNVWILPVAALAMVALAFVSAPRATEDTDTTPVAFGEVATIVAQRCQPCHSKTPTQPGFIAPPAGLAYDEPEQLSAHADRIQKALSTNFMPPGNLTKMTAEERAKVLRWLKQGAKTDAVP